MTSNPDPKPGRWILPLVIVGMIGFTYLFVNSLEGSAGDDPANGADTTVGAGRTTTTAQGGNQGGQGDREHDHPQRHEQLGLHRRTASRSDRSRRDSRRPQPGEHRLGRRRRVAERCFHHGADEAADWAASVSEITPPDDAVDTHGEVVEAADAVAVAAAEVLEGYQAPDDGTLRREAVEAFNDAVAAFDRAVDSSEGEQGA